MEHKRKFTILTIDGGGIRGLIPAKVLAELERELKLQNPSKPLFEYFDLICGTSTGAILTIAIALGIPAVDLVQFYKENAPYIFPKFYLKVIPRKTRALLSSIYSNNTLRQKLKDIYTNANNGQVPLINDLKTKVCIPVFNGNEGQINVIKTKHCDDYYRDYKLPAHEVALSSASAPIYFQPHTFSFSNEFGEGINVNMIDGGIFANNPALIGILEATEKLDYDFSEIRLLSLGTGKGKHIIKKALNTKGIMYWLFPKPRLLDIILDSQAQVTEQYLLFLQRMTMKRNNGFEYFRVQHDLGSDTIDLNTSDQKDIQRLESIGDELAKNKLDDILNFLKS